MGNNSVYKYETNLLKRAGSALNLGSIPSSFHQTNTCFQASDSLPFLNTNQPWNILLKFVSHVKNNHQVLPQTTTSVALQSETRPPPPLHRRKTTSIFLRQLSRNWRGFSGTRQVSNFMHCSPEVTGSIFSAHLRLRRHLPPDEMLSNHEARKRTQYNENQKLFPDRQGGWEHITWWREHWQSFATNQYKTKQCRLLPRLS